MNRFNLSRRRAAAFTRLVQAHGSTLATLAHRLVGALEAEDAVQAALTSAWRHFVAPETLRNPRAWLLRFLIHECSNLVARRLRRPLSVTLELEHQSPAGPVEDIVSILQREIACSIPADPRVLLEYVDEGLSRAVQKLSEEERVTLMLRAVAEFSYKEIAETMDVPLGTVMSRLCRTREKIRVALAPSGTPLDPPQNDARRPLTAGSEAR